MHYSDEIINAYIDGELEGPEREKFKDDLQNNEELANKVRILCGLKCSLKSSYSQIPLPGPIQQDPVGFYFGNIKLAVVAVLILCVGYFLGSAVNVTQIKSSPVVHNDVIKGIKLTPVSLQESNKIILHIASGDTDILYKTLYKIDTILEKYRENEIPFELEVVANSGGINLFREETSPYKNRIKQIMKNYTNVTFIVCANAIERLRMQGVEPGLIAHTETGVTAIEQIVKRLQQGWVYIKV
jgi:hypothetical protein